MARKEFTLWTSGICTILMLASVAAPVSGQASVVTENQNASHKQPAPASQDDQVKSVQKNVDSQTGDQTSDKQAEVREDAVAALRAARHALRALDDGDADEAMASLETAIGKLQIILARDPKLAFVPVGVEITKLDTLASPEDIRRAIDEAERMLKKGRVQEARHMLAVLGSEIVIHETSLPLVTFPPSLAMIAPLIDEGKLDAARSMLTETLNTMVVTDHVIPLPLVRADLLIEKAGELAAVTDRSESQSKELNEALDSAEKQIEMARLLGYGTEDDFDELAKEMKTIREKIKNHKNEEGFVDKIRNKIKAMRESLFG